MDINMRYSYQVRWSTEPRHCGYAQPSDRGKPSLEELAPDFTGTPRQVIEYMDNIRRKIGQSVSMAAIVSRGGEHMSFYIFSDRYWEIIYDREYDADIKAGRR